MTNERSFLLESSPPALQFVTFVLGSGAGTSFKNVVSITVRLMDYIGTHPKNVSSLTIRHNNYTMTIFEDSLQ
jgi:hypothetical protein